MSVERVTEHAGLVLAPNPGPMTLDGTNSWILRAPGDSRAVVVDPGPLMPDHLQAILDAVEAAGCSVEVVLLTHGHPDHSEGAGWFAERAGCGVRSVDPAFRVDPGLDGSGRGDQLDRGDPSRDELSRDDLDRDELGRDELGRDEPGRDELGRDELGRDDLDRDDVGRDELRRGMLGRGDRDELGQRGLGGGGLGREGLAEGDVIVAGDLRIEVLATPGHTRDSVCFWLPQDGSLLTGDTVLGRGTSVVAHPDGALGPYLDSLARLEEFVASAPVERLLPGHGPVIEDAAGVLAFYLQHRRERLDQVRAAVAAGATTARDVVERVYADVDPVLWPAAERSVQAQLTYLAGA